MAKYKTTITVERRKVEEARRLTGAASTSAAIDLALDRLIRSERLRRDITAYTGTPPTEAEVVLATITPSWSDLADETDWDALYGEEG
jgi:Bacterial antitoxin of type II TA system, VapB